MRRQIYYTKKPLPLSDEKEIEMLTPEQASEKFGCQWTDIMIAELPTTLPLNLAQIKTPKVVVSDNNNEAGRCAFYAEQETLEAKQPVRPYTGKYFRNSTEKQLSGTCYMLASALPQEDKKHELQNNQSLPIVDAYAFGNEARFFQHLPTKDERDIRYQFNEKAIRDSIAVANLVVQYVQNDLGDKIPYLFSSIPIKSRTQLGFPYGDIFWLSVPYEPRLFDQNADLIPKSQYTVQHFTFRVIPSEPAALDIIRSFSREELLKFVTKYTVTIFGEEAGNYWQIDRETLQQAITNNSPYACFTGIPYIEDENDQKNYQTISSETVKASITNATHQYNEGATLFKKDEFISAQKIFIAALNLFNQNLKILAVHKDTKQPGTAKIISEVREKIAIVYYSLSSIAMKLGNLPEARAKVFYSFLVRKELFGNEDRKTLAAKKKLYEILESREFKQTITL